MVDARIGTGHRPKHFIKEWMKAKSVTQEQMAGRLEVSQGTISKILKKPTAMTQAYMAAIAHALELDISDLFRDPKRPTREELLAGLDEGQVEQVIRIIDTFRRDGTTG